MLLNESKKILIESSKKGDNKMKTIKSGRFIKSGTSNFGSKVNNMKLEFGKYTDITNFAKKVNPYMFEVYEKIYICPDTNNYWLSTIQKDIDENYEESLGTYLVERDDVDYPEYDGRFNESSVKEVLENWDGSTYDNYEVESIEDAIDIIDGGYGIIPESEITNSHKSIKSANKSFEESTSSSKSFDEVKKGDVGEDYGGNKVTILAKGPASNFSDADGFEEFVYLSDYDPEDKEFKNQIDAEWPECVLVQFVDDGSEVVYSYGSDGVTVPLTSNKKFTESALKVFESRKPIKSSIDDDFSFYDAAAEALPMCSPAVQDEIADVAKNFFEDDEYNSQEDLSNLIYNYIDNMVDANELSDEAVKDLLDAGYIEEYNIDEDVLARINESEITNSHKSIKSSRKPIKSSSVPRTTKELADWVNEHTGWDVDYDEKNDVFFSGPENETHHVKDGRVVTDGNGWTEDHTVEEFMEMMDEKPIKSSRKPIKSSITQRELKDMIRRGQAIDITGNQARKM